MKRWVAVFNGALEIGSESHPRESTSKIAITPVLPGAPLMITGDVANLWLSLVGAGRPDDQLSVDDRALAREFVAEGIAEAVTEERSGLQKIEPNWFDSFQHELVSALVSQVAKLSNIECLVIKGPTLHAQGLRDRAHSGDVDVLVRPEQASMLVRAMEPWGWTARRDPMAGTPLAHSLTLLRGTWGCEIDVHFRFPGICLEPGLAFDRLWTHTEEKLFAGIEGATLDVPAHALIQALTLTRPVPGRPAGRLCDQAVSVLKVGGLETLMLAVDLGAIGALHSELTAALPAAEIRSEAPPAEWLWLSQPNPARTYLAVLKATPLQQRPRAVWKIVSASGLTADGTREHAIRRWLRGAKQLLRRPAG